MSDQQVWVINALDARDVGVLSTSVAVQFFNFLGYPTDLVLMVVRWRLRYCLSLRNLSEMMLERGFEFTHEAVRS